MFLFCTLYRLQISKIHHTEGSGRYNIGYTRWFKYDRD